MEKPKNTGCAAVRKKPNEFAGCLFRLVKPIKFYAINFYSKIEGCFEYENEDDILFFYYQRKQAKGK